jgi:hypothetical protein
MTHESLNMRSLLVIDQEPIRNTAKDELTDLYGKMRRLRSQIDEFESVDKPAFMRWLRHEFQKQLDDLNSLQEKLIEAEEIVSEVQTVRLALGCSYYDAYVNTMERRNLYSQAEDFDEEEEEFARGGFKSKGSRADEEPDVDSANFGADSDSDADSERDQKRGKGSDGETSEGLGFWSAVREKTGNAFESLKQKYRELARLLHPDLRGGGDSWTHELWQRTQKAYSEKDSSELGEILILARASVGEIGNDSSIWDLHKASNQLRKILRDVRREVTQLKQDMAWGFTHLTDKTRLRRRIAYDIEYQHDEVETRLEALDGQLARWSVPTSRASNQRRTRSRANARQRSAWDLDLDF